jgi:hypothetical protein
MKRTTHQSKRLVLAAFIAAIGATSCYSATIRLSPEAGARSPVLDDKMSIHLLNVIPLNGEHNLAAVCPNSTAVAIHDHVTVLGGLINMLLGTYVPVLSVWNSSADCSVSAPQPASAPVQ